MPTPDTTSALPTDLMKRIVWRLAPLMVLMYVANQLDRANVGYAALTMNAELGMTAAQYGLSASLFFLGYILCEIPSNLCMSLWSASLDDAHSRILGPSVIIDELCAEQSLREVIA